MTTLHPPTPLVADEKVYCHVGLSPNGRDWVSEIYGLDGDGHIFAEAYGFSEEEARSNAALIVKAGNSHDALVNALLETRQTLNQALGVIVEFGNLNGFRNLSDQELGKAVQTMAESAAQQIENADSALALAGVK